jgi:hypothetical protein
MMSRVSGDLVSCPAPSSFFAILGAELTLNNLSEFWVPPQSGLPEISHCSKPILFN